MAVSSGGERSSCLPRFPEPARTRPGFLSPRCKRRLRTDSFAGAMLLESTVIRASLCLTHPIRPVELN